MSDAIAMTDDERCKVQEALMKIQCAEPRAPTLTRRAQLDRVAITEPTPPLLLRWLLPIGFMAMVIGIGFGYTVKGLAGWLGTL